MRFAEYYQQLVSIIDCPEYPVYRYNRLFNYLYTTRFRWSVKNDVNRATDGLALRNRIAKDPHLADTLGPCRVLEMLIALAIRCENDIMQEKSLGDRTAIWFWTMIENLDLATMQDADFNLEYVKSVVTRFMDRRFSRNGYGSIFFANYRHEDFRASEFWDQMNWFLAEQYDCTI